jgi:hypothetical protein
MRKLTLEKDLQIIFGKDKKENFNYFVVIQGFPSNSSSLLISPNNPSFFLLFRYRLKN